MRKAGVSLEEVKQKVMALKGNDVEMMINRGRKKMEKIYATVENTFPSVFTVKGSEDSKIQTFSYFDVLCGDVEII